MRVSPKKRAANRRNALKSTGPKTASGRRLSAQNATKHGLSVPLPPQLIEPVQQQLVQLILSDGFDREIANNLAEKIIEYERNILYLNDIFQNETLLQYALDDIKRIEIHHQKVEQKKLVKYLKDVEQLEFEVEQREGFNVQDQKILQDLNQIKRTFKGMISTEKIIVTEKAANSQRYLKRASNQLIKALRRL